MHLDVTLWMSNINITNIIHNITWENEYYDVFHQQIFRSACMYAGWSKVLLSTNLHVRIQRGGGGGGGQGGLVPLKNHKNNGFLSNTGPDPLKNHKATKPAYNARPSSARQQNAILMAFCWRVNNGPL